MSLPQFPTSSVPPQLPGGPPPVQVAIGGSEPQRRLTVLVRLILVIPHAIVLFFLAIGAFVVAFLGWWGALFMGQLPEFAQSYLTGFIRWSSRVQAYLLLLTDAYPPFTLDDDPEYPLHIATTRERLNRWAVFFRFILFIPVSILNTILGYGASTIILFIAWVIVLITGQLPTSLHLAYSAVLRFQIRFYSYTWLLTPTYPGGLFGDDPSLAGTAPGAPGAPGGYGPPAGYGAPGGYGSNPGGYGTPGAYGQPSEPVSDNPSPGYGTPAAPGYGSPAGGTPNPYGQPPAAPGYGTPPGGYGQPPAAPGYGGTPGYGAGQPTPGWQLVLTAGAKRLVVLFIVLGAILYVTQLVEEQHSGVSSFSFSTADPAAANSTVTTAYNKLNNQVSQFQSSTDTCDGDIQCLATADHKAASDFSQFGQTVKDTNMPTDAQPAAAAVVTDSDSVSADLNQLATATSADQYESLVNSTGLEKDSTQFDADVTKLKSQLTSDENS